ncbi:hypothetical protein BEWA_033210 [Theileria equi strain WA]|uniref:Uncharacterized protein n=1 Tax=Theileria equi strain WA TaxID=1537102 RepID=L0AZ07_THEEQ|nr:hypothetical protein BEWA_033210 [Theileria equi strain WA]AFZ80468.1 hypothetical protein BEWA_033210 [Theileria equi strain WA]|eukprot:XP_004830134.1 hypothetical protein BEWA_033210 [Theileria equi strain WA]
MSKSKLGSFLSSKYLCDPYIQLLHCKRTVRFLKIAKADGARMLILGNKHRHSVNLGPLLSHSYKETIKVTPEVLINAPGSHDLILCFDPVFYARHLYNVNLPRIAICTFDDLYQHRDIPDAFDYLIPLRDEQSDVSILDSITEEEN